jgi:hypothetical protein
VSVAKALFHTLKTNAGISAICSGVYSLDAEDAGVIPRLVFDVSDEERDRTYQGATGLLKANAEIDCIGRSSTEARQLGDAVVAALDNQRGSWNGVVVMGVYFRGASEHADSPNAGVGTATGTLTFTRSVQFDFWINEQV